MKDIIVGDILLAVGRSGVLIIPDLIRVFLLQDETITSFFIRKTIRHLVMLGNDKRKERNF